MWKDFEAFELYQGMAQWDARNAMSGKKAFLRYDYGRYAAEMRLDKQRFYSVVPEFRDITTC